MKRDGLRVVIARVCRGGKERKAEGGGEEGKQGGGRSVGGKHKDDDDEVRGNEEEEKRLRASLFIPSFSLLPTTTKGSIGKEAREASKQQTKNTQTFFAALFDFPPFF